jgi:hypothetical protein
MPRGEFLRVLALIGRNGVILLRVQFLSISVVKQLYITATKEFESADKTQA